MMINVSMSLMLVASISLGPVPEINSKHIKTQILSQLYLKCLKLFWHRANYGSGTLIQDARTFMIEQKVIWVLVNAFRTVLNSNIGSTSLHINCNTVAHDVKCRSLISMGGLVNNKFGQNYSVTPHCLVKWQQIYLVNQHWIVKWWWIREILQEILGCKETLPLKRPDILPWQSGIQQIYFTQIKQIYFIADRYRAIVIQ